MDRNRSVIYPEIRTIDEENYTITHVINTKVIDRYNTAVLPTGADVKQFLKNPVVLWFHNIGKENSEVKIPIAKCVKLEIEDEQITATTKFNKNEPFAIKVFNSYKDGFLKAWSIGFMPLKYVKYTIENRKELNKTYGLKVKEEQITDAGFWGIYIIHKWELLEYSAVPVPGNPEALSSPDSEVEFKKQLVMRGLELNMELENKEKETEVEEVKTELQKQFESVQKEEDITIELALAFYYASDEEQLSIGEERAKWTKKFINSLPDSAFAVIEPAYKSGDIEDKNARHLPHHSGEGDLGKAKDNKNIDKPHLRNALARANQIKPITDSISVEDLRSKAMAHLERHKDALEEKKEAPLEVTVPIVDEVVTIVSKTVEENVISGADLGGELTELELEQAQTEPLEKIDESEEVVESIKPVEEKVEPIVPKVDVKIEPIVEPVKETQPIIDTKSDERISKLEQAITALTNLVTELTNASKTSIETITKKVDDLKKIVEIDNLDTLRGIEQSTTTTPQEGVFDWGRLIEQAKGLKVKE